MNGEQAELFQQLLEEACDHFIDDGGIVITKSFVNLKDGGQCPLTCLLGRRDSFSMIKELSEMLDTTISWNELWTFISAFDGVDLLDYQKGSVSMILVAQSLRKKYITKELNNG